MGRLPESRLAKRIDEFWGNVLPPRVVAGLGARDWETRAVRPSEGRPATAGGTDTA